MSKLALLPLLALAPFLQDPLSRRESVPQTEPATFTYSARVLDRETLAPIAGAKVRRLDGEVEVVTGEDGSFRFPIANADLPHCFAMEGGGVARSRARSEALSFTIAAPGASPLRVSGGYVRSDPRPRTLLLWRSADLRGKCLDADGLPVPGQRLRASSTTSLPFELDASFGNLEVETDTTGSFRFPELPSHIRWKLEPVLSEEELYELDAPEIELAPGETRTIEVRRPGSRKLAGTVRDSHGQVLEEAGVVLRTATGSVQTDTGPDGSFSIERLGLGTYELAVMHPQEDEVKQALVTELVVVTGSGEQRIELRTQPAGRIQGRLLDARLRPVGGGTIWFEPELLPYRGFADVREDGTFTIERLAQGPCRLFGCDHDGLRRSPGIVSRAVAKDLEVILERAGSVSGHVQCPEALRAEVTVEVESVDLSLESGTLEPHSRSSEVELELGSMFLFPNVPAGHWRVRAKSKKSKLVSASVEITIEAGKQTTCPDLVMQPQTQLFLIGGPGTDELEVEVWRESERLARTTLARETITVLAVPEGSLQVVAKRRGERVDLQSVEAVAGEPHLVGLGFAR
jgi:hypothetical protein